MTIESKHNAICSLLKDVRVGFRSYMFQFIFCIFISRKTLTLCDLKSNVNSTIFQHLPIPLVQAVWESLFSRGEVICPVNLAVERSYTRKQVVIELSGHDEKQ